MGQVSLSMETHSLRVQEAREQFFGAGELPSDVDLHDRAIVRSWARCRDSGFEPLARPRSCELVGEATLRESRERNEVMISHSRAVMEHVHEQIRHSGSMVILADARGLILHSVGDADFVSRAEGVALQPGASWHERDCGTNAVGTALFERRPVEVFGGEHFYDKNAFLTCSAAPLFDAYGQLMGVLDISGDYRAYQRHTLGLVRMSSQIIEKSLFESQFARELLLCFHTRPEFVGSLGEGLAALAPDGRLLAMNPAALEMLGLRREDVGRQHFGLIFDGALEPLLDRARRDPHGLYSLETRRGERVYLRLRGAIPSGTPSATGPESGRGRLTSSGGQASMHEVKMNSSSVRLPRQISALADSDRSLPNLDSLNTGDPRLQTAIDKARRILGRDIPILVQGESGAGKEMFAKSFHNSGPRHDGPFIALNCAAIPETLIESELFGYQGGAFTGARKEGAVGKIQQAHGGTLFLDEIGDMPLHLQARLLRVLQERCVTPVGSSKTIPVDISLVCATHRRLRDEVARGNFREDLYYRLNGLCVTLPALRERTDLRLLVARLIDAEVGQLRSVGVSEAAMHAFECYTWPGNLRQLNNVLRVAIALLDDDECLIEPQHLPEELFEEDDLQPRLVHPGAVVGVAASTAAPAPAQSSGNARLEDIELQVIQRTLDELGGNVSAAARRLGISRNTLYRKIGRL
ncbi:MAG: sigma-54-dependent Fis family transcriptional regulator [Zoogloea sp.]|nr:sigma-54-dependent Fis family transcriptional regulator [Zoogloea sp.]